MFQPSVETMPAEERAALQEQRLDALVTRLKSSDNPYWQQKLAGLEGSELESLPFTVKAELRDHYPFGTLAVPLADTVRIHASSGTRGKPTIVAYTTADLDVFADLNARALAAVGGPTTSSTTPTGTACSPVGSASTTAQSGWARLSCLPREATSRSSSI